MNKRKFISLLFASGILFFLGLLFVPRNYDVEAFKEREGTEYWNLETGSKIGYYKILGKPSNSKTPIIYLHGGPGGKITDEIKESLKPLSFLGHDLYFYDQIGSGHSDRLENIEEYSAERHTNDLAEIVNKIASDKVILIAHSWGSMLATNYLQNHPQRVEKMIISGPGPIMPVNWKLRNEVPPEHLSIIKPAFSNNEGNKKANNWRSKFMTKWAILFKRKLASDKEADAFFSHLNKELIKSTDCEYDENKRVEGGGGYYSHIMTVNSFQSVENKRKDLRDLSTPVLILRGQCDNQAWGYTQEYLDIFNNVELKIIEGVGHSIINREVEKYLELIGCFL